MRSLAQAGWYTGPRGANSTMNGFTSSTGVPSTASRPRTRSLKPSTSTSSHLLTPMRLGRALARWARMPTSGHSGLPRGRRAPRATSVSSTRWNRYTTSRCENSSRHWTASGSSSVSSSTIVASTSPQASSVRSVRPPTTRPMGSMLRSTDLYLQDLDHARVAVDFEEGAVGDGAGGAGDAHDGGDAELTGHDDGVAHLRANVHDDRLGGHEQRRPRRVGDRRYQDVAGRQPPWVEGVEYDACAAPGHARTAGDACQRRPHLGQLDRRVPALPGVGWRDRALEHERRHQRVEPVPLGPALVDGTHVLGRRLHVAAQFRLRHQPHVGELFGSAPLSSPPSQLALYQTDRVQRFDDRGLGAFAALRQHRRRAQRLVELP